MQYNAHFFQEYMGCRYIRASIMVAQIWRIIAEDIANNLYCILLHLQGRSNHIPTYTCVYLKNLKKYSIFFNSFSHLNI